MAPAQGWHAKSWSVPHFFITFHLLFPSFSRLKSSSGAILVQLWSIFSAIPEKLRKSPNFHSPLSLDWSTKAVPGQLWSSSGAVSEHFQCSSRAIAKESQLLFPSFSRLKFQSSSGAVVEEFRGSSGAVLERGKKEGKTESNRIEMKWNMNYWSRIGWGHFWRRANVTFSPSPHLHNE